MTQPRFLVPPSPLRLTNKRRVTLAGVGIVVLAVVALLLLFVAPLASSTGGESTSLSAQCGPAGCVPTQALPMSAGSGTSSTLAVTYAVSGAAVQLSVAGTSAGSTWSNIDLSGGGAFTVHGGGPYVIHIQLSPSGTFPSGTTVSASISLSWTATGTVV